MSINYPSSLDSFANPTSTDLMENASPALDHDVQHSNANDAIEALEAKVGADGSAVTTSHDYKLSGVTGSDKAVSKTGTETLTNKTLTSPVINLGSDATGDMYYRNSSGAYTRLPIGTSAQILNVDNVTGLPTWVANPSGSDASTTVKGVVEIATQAEVLAKTGTGGTGAKLVVSPDNMNSTLVYDGATDSVGTDSYAITLTPAPTAYTTYQKFTFKAGTANTGASTLNVNSLGAKTIKKIISIGKTDTATGDILANSIVDVIYDGTDMVITNVIPGTPNYPFITFQEMQFDAYNSLDNVPISSFNMTSETDGSVAYGCSVVANANSGINIYRFVRDATTGMYYVSHKVIYNAPGAITNSTAVSISVVGSFVYVAFHYSSTTAGMVRLAKADLTGSTAMTLSGSNYTSSCSCSFSDGTSVYVQSASGTFKKYTISGTTATYSADFTYTSAGTSTGAVCDGTNVWTLDASKVLRKYALAGGAATNSLTSANNFSIYTTSGKGIMFCPKTGYLAIGFSFSGGTTSYYLDWTAFTQI